MPNENKNNLSVLRNLKKQSQHPVYAGYAELTFTGLLLADVESNA